MLTELAGKVAVVTGAASGIGAAMCRRFAAEGMTVVAADIDGDGAAATAAAAGGHAVHVDVSDVSSVRALADRAFDLAGHVDLLCNNAGVFQGGCAWEASPADWEWALGVNLMGLVHGIAAFVPRMVAQGTEGHVVNTSSVAAVVSAPFSAPYVVSKSAAFSLTECLAHDLLAAGSRIGASVLVPSAVDTAIAGTTRVRPQRFGVDETDSGPMVRGFLREATAAGMSPDEAVEAVVDGIRAGTFVIATKPSFLDQLQHRFDHLRARRLPPLTDID